MEVTAELYDWTPGGMKLSADGHWIEKREVERLLAEADERRRKFMAEKIEEIIKRGG